MPKLLLIDGHSLAYRAFYSSPLSLTLPDGQPVNAVYGFISLLFKALEIFKPDSLAVCFDLPQPTFRHAFFPDYKAHRPPSPEEFRSQLPLLKEAINKLGIYMLSLAGYEGDDLIGTVSFLAEAENYQTLIMTGDRDAFQLISDQTTVIINKKGMSDFLEYTPDKLWEEFQLTPQQMLDLKALQGDKSDNIPGVPGIGEVTAKKLMSSYHSLDNVYQNLAQITPSIQTKLAQYKEQAYLSYKLVTIDRHAPINLKLEELDFKPNWGNILAVFQGFNFTSLVRKYQHNNSTPLFNFASAQNNALPAQAGPVAEYKLIENVEELQAILPELKQGFACVFKLNSLTVIDAQIVGVALSYKENTAYYIPFNQYLTVAKAEADFTQIALFSTPEDLSQKSNWQLNPFLAILQPLLEDESVPKYIHNGKEDYLVLKNYEIALKNIAFDPMLAAYLIDYDRELGLPELVKAYFYQDLITPEQVKEKLDFVLWEKSAASQYAGALADFTLRFTNELRPKMAAKQLEMVLYEIELPLQKILAEMEFVGISVDLPYLSYLQQDFKAELDKLTSQIYEQSGHTFNINSPKQLGEVLFEKMGLPAIKKNKEGFSTDADVLEKLANRFEIAKLLLRYRSLEKLLNTYINKLPILVNARTKRIHTSFNQTVTATGRLSSSKPNLQNIPIRTKEGEKIRKAFIAGAKDTVLLSADYSQVELRILAHLAEDPNLIEAFRQNEDIHASTASLIFNVELSAVTKELRNRAKTINFGIIYGMSAFGLSESLNISRAEAKEIIEAYMAKFPKIGAFIQDTIIFAQTRGLVQTLFGRMRLIPEINSPNRSRKELAIRMAVNTRVQGTASDLIKMAMIRVQKQLITQGLKTKMLLQIHDELLFEVPLDEQVQVRDMVKREMEQAVQLKVPIIVDLKQGKNWLEMCYDFNE